MTTPNRLASQRVVTASPMSFAGSAARTWRLTAIGASWVKLLTIPAAVVVIALWWTVIAVWYVIAVGVFGLVTIPFRLLRRGGRNRRRTALQHQEMLTAVHHNEQRNPS